MKFRSFYIAVLFSLVFVLPPIIAEAQDVIAEPSPEGTFSLTFNPSADAFVSDKEPNRNFGSESLRVKAKSMERVFMRFEIKGIRGEVHRAILTLRSWDPSDFGGTIRTVSNSIWTEDGITHANAPKIDGPEIGRLGAVKKNKDYTFDLTKAITGNGTYNFALTSESKDMANYASREDRYNPPELVVEYRKEGALPPPPPPPSPAAAKRIPKTGFVDVDSKNARFTLDGKPFHFTGTNNFWLMQQQSYGNNERKKVEDAFKMYEDLGIKVVRTWGFADGFKWTHDKDQTILQETPGKYKEHAFKSMDYVINEAGKRGIKLVITLVNNWEEFGGMNQYVEWAGAQKHDDFFTNSKVKGLFKNYISDFLNRVNTYNGLKYKDDPAIMAWEIANEARMQTNPSPKGMKLRDWYREIARHIRSIDTHHLIATGEEGFDCDTDGYMLSKYSNTWMFNGSEGTCFTKNTALEEIDYGGAHLYIAPWKLKWQDGNPWIKDHTAVARKLGKPFVLGEYGNERKEENPVVYKEWLNTADLNNSGGALLWQINPESQPPSDEYGVSYPKNKEILDVVRVHAKRMNAKAGPVVETPEPPTPSPEPSPSPKQELPTATPAPAPGPSPKPAPAPQAEDRSGKLTTHKPVADAYVTKESPSKNYGLRNELKVDGDSIARIYLRFDVSNLRGPVQSATLKLRNLNPSEFGGAIHLISDSTWKEDAINFRNAPPVDGKEIARIGAVKQNKDYTFDLTSVIKEKGIYNFVIVSDNSDGADYSSRESKKDQPLLTIVEKPPDKLTTLKFPPVADAHVKKDKPFTNYGGEEKIEVDGNGKTTSYLRFAVSGLGGEVKSATLKVRNVSSSFGDAIHLISDSTWKEDAINFRNAPPVDGKEIARIDKVEVGNDYVFDLASVIKEDGIYNFALVSDKRDGADYESREGKHPPQLSVVFQEEALGPIVETPPEPAPEPVISQKVEAAEAAVQQDEEVKPEEVGKNNVGLLPTSFLYPLKNIRRAAENIVAAASFNPVRKAEARLKHASERFLEIQELTKKDGLKDEKVVAKNLEKAGEILEEAKAEVKKIDPGLRGSERAEELLKNIVDTSIKHERIIGKLIKEAPADLIDNVRATQEKIRELAAETPPHLVLQEKIPSVVLEVVESQRGSGFKDFKHAEVLNALKHRAPQEAKPAFSFVAEQIHHTVTVKLESLPEKEKQEFVGYVKQLGGDPIRHAEVIVALEARPVSPETREVLIRSKERAFEKLEETVAKIDESTKKQFFEHLGEGTLENLRFIKDFEQNLSPDIVSGVITDLKEQTSQRLAEKVRQEKEKSRYEFEEMFSRFPNVQTLAAMEEVVPKLAAPEKEFMNEMRLSFLAHARETHRDSPLEVRANVIRAVAGDHPENLYIASQLSASIPREYHDFMQEVAEAGFEEISQRITLFEDKKRLGNYAEDWRKYKDDLTQVEPEKTKIIDSSLALHYLTFDKTAFYKNELLKLEEELARIKEVLLHTEDFPEKAGLGKTAQEFELRLSALKERFTRSDFNNAEEELEALRRILGRFWELLGEFKARYFSEVQKFYHYETLKEARPPAYEIQKPYRLPTAPPHELTPPPVGVQEEDRMLREKLRNDSVFGCVTQRIGEESAKALREGLGKFNERTKILLFECVFALERGLHPEPPPTTEPTHIPPPPIKVIAPEPLPQPPPEPTPLQGCFDEASCTRVCYDQFFGYYNSETCVRYRATKEGPVPPPSSTVACADGRDNDSDGQVDYPADTGCYGPNDTTEYPEADSTTPPPTYTPPPPAYTPQPPPPPSTGSCPAGYHYVSTPTYGSYCESDTNFSICQPVGGGTTYTCPHATISPPPSSSVGCYDELSCSTVCRDTTHPEYQSFSCQEWRTYHPQ